MCFTLIHVDGIKDRHATGQAIVEDNSIFTHLLRMFNSWVGTKTFEIFPPSTFHTEHHQTITIESELCLFVCILQFDCDMKKKMMQLFCSILLIFLIVVWRFIFFSSRDTPLSWPDGVTTGDKINWLLSHLKLVAWCYILLEILTNCKA